ncbi:MAG: alpha/beta hydrolase-fold protein [Acidobacteriaceae bacterium]|nr:alpha/beta hydrolase-fold protein [Acidobacteriaceae bacterium]
MILVAIFLLTESSAISQESNTPTRSTESARPPSPIEEVTLPPFNDYPLGPDSKSQPTVPHGKTFRFEWSSSTIFPGTTRTITVYVPAEYNSDKPACTFIFLDGIGFNAPTVFDNLIAQHAMPVTIAIGVSPAQVESSTPGENPRFDRSMEFDTMSDRLARFLLHEILPAVEQQHTLDGKPIRLIDNPDARAIAGSSTGGIGSFTVAWQHPEAFHRVFTSIGTFVGMRGGESYYVQVRKTEPKPIRIFMEDGVNDEWAGAEMGDWWMSNLTMSRALEFAGYDVRHMWGAGTHNSAHAKAIFPEAVRWLWHDWPQPIVAQPPGNRVLKTILKSGEGWRVISADCSVSTELHADKVGRILWGKANDPRWLSLDTPRLPCTATEDRPNAIGPEGTIFVAEALGDIQRISPNGVETTVSTGTQRLNIQHLTVRSGGEIYALVRAQDGHDQLWILPTNGTPRMLDADLHDASGLAFSPDGLWLFVTQKDSRFGLNYRVRDDGSLDAREPFYIFDLSPSADQSGAGQIAMDRDGRAYVATALGIQVFDRNGRVAAILPLPGNAVATGIAFGGPQFDVLFVSAGGKLYRRKLQVSGVAPWAFPIKLPPWSPG